MSSSSRRPPVNTSNGTARSHRTRRPHCAGERRPRRASPEETGVLHRGQGEVPGEAIAAPSAHTIPMGSREVAPCRSGRVREEPTGRDEGADERDGRWPGPGVNQVNPTRMTGPRYSMSRATETGRYSTAAKSSRAACRPPHQPEGEDPAPGTEDHPDVPATDASPNGRHQPSGGGAERDGGRG